MRKRTVGWLVAAFVVGAAVYLWFRAAEGGFGWREFGRNLATLDPRWAAACCACALATYGGRALRWAVLIRPMRPRPSYRNLLSATVLGFTALVLFGRPGEFVRPYLIAQKEKLPLASQLAAWTIERIYDLLAALLLFGFALSQVDRSSAQVGPALKWVFQTGGWAIVILGAGCLAAFLVIRSYGNWARDRLMAALGFLREHHLARVEGALNSFLEGAASTRSASSIGWVLAYTALEWLLIAGCFLCALRAFPGLRPFGWLDVLILMGFVTFGSLVQLPGVGGGPQVVTLVVLRELFKVPVEAATGVALALWAMTFLVVVPVGVPLALLEGISWSRMRDLGRQGAS
jgi:hypothetical protein